MNKASKYAKNRINGYSKYESALRAGYAPATARNAYTIEKTKDYQNFWQNLDVALQALGVDEYYIADKLKSALGAKKSTFFNGQEVVGKQDDHKTQLKAIELYFKIRFEALKGFSHG